METSASFEAWSAPSPYPTALTQTWVPHDVRDEVVDFVRRWSDKTEISVGRFLAWLGVAVSKFYDWRERYGRLNEHNRWVPRDFWLEPWEKEAIIHFHLENPLAGYRRLTFWCSIEISWPSVRLACGRCRSRPGGGRAGRRGHRARALAWNSRSRRSNTGMSMFPTSTCRARFTTYAACSRATAVLLCIGTCASR